MLKCSLFIVSYLKVRERHGYRCHFWLQQSPRPLLHTRQRKGWPTAVWAKSLSPGLNRMAWKLYYNTNNYKMHIYRQENFNSHPYQNNFKRYFLESKATNQIHHNLIMHKQTLSTHLGPDLHPLISCFPFILFVYLSLSAVRPLCTLFPLNLSELIPCVPLFQSCRLPPFNPWHALHPHSAPPLVAKLPFHTLFLCSLCPRCSPSPLPASSLSRGHVFHPFIPSLYWSALE